MLEVVTTQQNVQAFYIGPTFNQARGAVWDELVDWSKPYGGIANESRLEIKFPATGSKIRIFGAETKKTIDRIRSQKRVAYIAWDEMAMYGHDFSTYGVASVIRPALADVKGRLVLAGTGGPERGFWWEVVTQPERGYVVSRASIWENPTIDNPDEEVDGACRDRGVTRADPYMRREWGSPEKGIEFTTDSARSVFRPIVMRVLELLPGGRFLLGGDVGSADASGLAVYWIHPEFNGIALVASEKRKTPASSDQTAFFREYLERYQPLSTGKVLLACDPGGGGKGVIEDLARLGGFWEALPADKFDKASNCRWMASDAASGFLTVLPGNEAAVTDLQDLEWKPGHEGEQLSDRHAGDAGDAALYGYRLAKKLFSYAPAPEASSMDPATLAFIEQQDAERRFREDLGLA
jgi:hypothetical protein